MQRSYVKARIYYGMHMETGVAEYVDDGEAWRLLVQEEALKKSDKNFQGCPVYVYHADDTPPEDLDQLRNEADGFVIDSFYLPCDGKHWCKFIVNTNEGVDAVEVKKWALSNAYKPSKDYKSGGTWHNVSYDMEVLNLEYEHLAIVPNPRYENSVILTPEQFKEYCDRKENDIKRVANSNNKGVKEMKFNYFKKTKVKNSEAEDFDTLVVELPKSKREIILSDLIANADRLAVAEDKGGDIYANGKHKVKFKNADGEDQEMTVNELIEEQTKNSKKKKNEDEKDLENESDEEMENEDEDEVENESEDEVENEDDEKEKEEMPKNSKKKKNAVKTKKNSSHFETLKNAGRFDSENIQTIYLANDSVSIGKSKYGSK